MVSSMITETRRIGGNLSLLVSVDEKNRKLKERISVLSREQEKMEEILLENQRFKKLLDYRNEVPYALIPARIIGSTPYVWYSSLVIDKGRRQGIADDLAVIAYQDDKSGVVGRISGAVRDVSKVRLLTDVSSEIAAMVQRTRDHGVVAGSMKKFLRMKYLSLHADVKEGDVIITSGLGGIFPKGLVIGHVRSVVLRRDALYLDVSVEPEIEFAKLEEVLVIKGVKEFSIE